METMAGDAVLEDVGRVAKGFAHDRRERQARRHLDPGDFEALARAGLQSLVLPASHGGPWRSLGESLGPVCGALRCLARGDGSVALAAAMHATVLLPWQDGRGPDGSAGAAWEAQRARVFDSVAAGAWWGTLKSEPGSGGDLARTRTLARRAGGSGPGWRLSGDKHFGTGAGVFSFFVSVAVPEGESEPDLFVLDLRDVPWDGSRGVKLVAEWDGLGMRATQSHAFRLEDFPAERVACSRAARGQADAGTCFDQCAFGAVILGIVDAAVAAAAERVPADPVASREWEAALADRAEAERVWSGAVAAVEREGAPLAAALRAKLRLAELAPGILERLCRVVGGSSYSRREPFGAWLQDVRALAFLRPPWALAASRLAALEG